MKGRTYAKSVNFMKTGGRVGIEIWLLLAALLILPLLALLWLPIPWWLGAGAIFVISAITYGMYAHDKRRAVSAGQRIPESTLHLAELLGGWPGALLAQRRLRHKCSKSSYQIVYWLIVLLFQLASMDMILEHRLSRALFALVTRLD